MRLTLYLFLFFSVSASADFTDRGHTQLIQKATNIIDEAVSAETLDYVSESCAYFKGDVPFTGYVLHQIEDQFRYNVYFEGKYTGEEWIFDKAPAVAHLKEFRLRADSSDLYMEVRTYYNFETNQVHEIYVDHRYECAKRKEDPKPFDLIFGSNERDHLPYQSYYESGQLEMISTGRPWREGKTVYYYESGQVKSIRKWSDNARVQFLKEYTENGKCTWRVKRKERKLKGGYAIIEGKFYLVSSAQKKFFSEVLY